MNAMYRGLLDMLGADEQNRLEIIRRRWETYYGKTKPPLKVRQGETDDNVRLNYARVIVDKGVSFLFGQDVGFEIDETANTKAEAWLAGVWERNKKMTLLQQAALVGSVTGHVFVKIVNEPPLPRLVVIDPESVTVSLAPDDIERVIEYKIQYISQDPKTKKPVGIRQLIQQDGAVWRITDQVGDIERLSWQTIGEATWAYPFPPIVHCQNLPAPGEFWGQSDIEDDVIEIIRAINFIASNTARIIKNHAHPQPWARGINAKELRSGIGETIVIPNPQGELHALEAHGDIGSSMAYLDALRQSLHEISRVPEVATGRLAAIGVPSGVALQILYQPLVEKTETKRRLYGDMLIELNRRLLALGGHGDELRTALHWKPMLPGDPMQERQAALIDNQLGASKDTLLQKLGYNPDMEREKAQVEQGQLGESLLTAFDKGQNA